MRCDFGEPGITRSAVVRFSTPQVACVGAQKPGTRREKAFTVCAKRLLPTSCRPSEFTKVATPSCPRSCVFPFE